MPSDHRCDQGHSWRADDASQVAFCPACGRPAVRLESELQPTVRFRQPGAATPPPPTVDHNPPDSASTVTLPAHRSTVFTLPTVRIAGYEILEEIGRGGMGIVCKARQLALGRIVAIKMLQVGTGTDPDLMTRLQTEAEVIAELQHPNIIQIIEIGTCEAGTFLVMEFASGGNLTSRLGGQPQPPRVAARLVHTLARAIQAAHEKGIIHRDIKPSNVQILEGPETPLERCTLKISDFGLARRLDETCGLTLSGQVIGTPGYMAPEQAQGASQALGPATDIYALGVLLYEALTGRPPYRGSTSLETVHLMLSQEPLPPSRLRPQLSRDLETICLECLHRSPTRRYQSAAALADDLERFLNHRPILARPTPTWEQLLKWSNRHPGTATLASCIIAVIVISFCLVTWQWRRAEKAHARSVEEHDRALKLASAEAQARHQYQQMTARFLLQRGVGLCESGEYGHGLLWLARALEATPDDNSDLQRSLLLLLGGWAQQVHLLRHYHAHPRAVYHVAVRRDGRLLASATRQRIRFVDPQTGQPIGKELQPNGTILRLGSASAGLWAVLHSARTLQVISLPDGIAMGPTIAISAEPRCAALSVDGQRLLVGFEDFKARLYQVSTGQQQGEPWLHKGIVRAVAFRSDGQQAVTGCNDHLARVWDVARGQLIHTLREHRGAVVSVAYSPDGSLIATGGEIARTYVWDSATGALKHRLRGEDKSTNALVFHPSEPLLVTGGQDDIVRLWDTRSGRPVAAVLRHADDINDLAFSPDGQLLVTGSDDQTVRVWTLRTPTLGTRVMQHQHPVRCMALSRDNRVVVGTSESRLKLCDLSAPATEKTLVSNYPLAAAFSLDGKRLVVGFHDGRAQLFDSKTFEAVGEPWRHVAPVLAVAFDPTGQQVATGCDDGDKIIRIRDVTTGRVLRTIAGHTRKVVALAFSPDGQMLLSGSWDRTARLWDVSTGEPIGKIMEHRDLVQSVAFHPDGRVALTGGDDFTTRLWDVPTGEPRGVPLRHVDKIHAVLFSPSGDLFATAGKSGLVRMWDPGTGKPIGPAMMHSWEAHSLAFTADGKELLSGSWDGTVKRWPVPARLSEGRFGPWLEVHTGHRLDDPGILVPLDIESWTKRVESLAPTPMR